MSTEDGNNVNELENVKLKFPKDSNFVGKFDLNEVGDNVGLDTIGVVGEEEPDKEKELEGE